MGRPLRVHQDPDTIFFITNRCSEERFFFTPSPELNAIVAGCLARSVKRHRVDVFAFVFMSNHFHMLLRAPRLNMSEFMHQLQSNIARLLNAFHDRNGAFFAGRYHAQPVLDDAALIDKYVYIAANPCAAHLVDRVHEWPGLHSHRLALANQPLVGSWTEGGHRKRTHTARFSIAPLPSIEHPDTTLDPALLHAKIEAREAELRAQRRAEKRRVAGARKVCSTHHSKRPKRPKRTQQPRCHTTCARTRARFTQDMRALADMYRAVYQRWRQNPRRGANFPTGTYPPSHTRPVMAA